MFSPDFNIDWLRREWLTIQPESISISQPFELLSDDAGEEWPNEAVVYSLFCDSSYPNVDVTSNRLLLFSSLWHSPVI